MAERHPTDNPPAVWPPPPDTPAAPAVEALPLVQPRNGLFADVFVYGAVWTLAALMAFGTAWAIAVHSPLAALLLPPIGVMVLVLTWPLNAIWLVCMIGFSLLHRACLGWLERRYPSAPDAARVRGRSVMIGAGLGPILAAVACLVSVQLHLPGPYDGREYPINEVQRVLTLLMYGASSWLASVAAGGAIGWLWTRRMAARMP